MKDAMPLGTSVNSLLLSFIEQAKNVAGTETVIALEATSCGHKTIGTCSCTNKYVIIWCSLYFVWEH
jgi:hypothetical protein